MLAQARLDILRRLAFLAAVRSAVFKPPREVEHVLSYLVVKQICIPIINGRAGCKDNCSREYPAGEMIRKSR
jgi:hypothetical protein